MTLTIKQLNKSKLPIVVINTELDELADKILFPEKLKEANRILKEVDLQKTKKRKS